MKNINNFTSRFRILKGGKISLVVSAMMTTTTLTFASPSGGNVTSGTANISQNGTTTNINQTTNNATINWNKFDIASNETVNFKQPTVNSITLNRVIGNESSVINGALNANGQVWILNSNGILFGKNASINTAGLVATTAELSDNDFNKNNYYFKNNSSESVINLGTIEVSNNGSVVLAANEVVNSGTIKAVKGKVHLTAASEYTVNLNGNSLVNLIVSKGVLDAMVENSGTISANGGEIYLTTNAVNELLKGVVNNTGIIEANSLDGLMGKVEVFAHGGTANVAGTIEAKDGFVETSGKDFKIESTAKVIADEWLIDPTNINIDDSSAYETSLNAGTNVTIETVATGSENGDINVNDEIEWNTANTLTLKAHNDININADITSTNANGKLALHYGQANGNSGNTSTYNVNAKVNLKAGNNFETKLGNDAEMSATTWTVVTSASTIEGMSKTGNTVLGADVDASSIENWEPIGGDDYSNSFKGKFDGLGHTISNLTIDRSSEYYVGLFGYTRGATIKNIGLVDVNVTGLGSVGGLVGSNTSSSITNSYASGTVSGNNSVGGLVGEATDNSTITNSYASGTVSGNNSVGGLVGNNYISTITNSYASGTVNGTESISGGLVGSNYSSKITNSYASGTVSGTFKVGGLVGDNFYSTINNSFYDSTNTITNTDTTNNIGKTKVELLALVTDETWDSSIWGTVGSTAEGYVDNKSLPYLKGVTASLFNSGLGTEANPYTITNWTQLQNINTNSDTLTNGYHFDLSNSIDKDTSDYTDLASSTANNNLGWNPIGDTTNRFEGTFDGQKFTVSDLTINRQDDEDIGFFGYTSGAIIKNIGLVNANVSGKKYVGGLIGDDSNSTITNSYASGSVTGTDVVGGLLGSSENSDITNSYTSSSVTGANYIGGLIGYISESTITNSYASGSVTGTDVVGGLIGDDYNSTITNSFYDSSNDISNTNTTSNIGKTKAEIITAFRDIDDTPWTIADNDSSVEGYGVLALPYLTSLTRNEDKSFTTLFNSGYGTEANPYTITNWTQLQNINNSNILTQSYYFDLLNSIDKDTSDYTNLASSTANDSKGWNPLGDSTNNFKGTFDGQNYTISDLTITREDEDYVGLFGRVDTDSSISNIILKDIKIEGNKYVGGLIGYSQATLSNIKVSGSVKGTDNYVGGLVAYNKEGSIKNSYSTGTVSGDKDNIGGLVGKNKEGSIENSYSTGTVSGRYDIGGLVGENDSGSIKNSYSTGAVSGRDEIGGLVGGNEDGTIENSYSTGIVSGTYHIGGLVGENYEGSIKNSYSTGAVSGDDDNIGGLVGRNKEGSIENSYSTGAVSGVDDIGGLVGENDRGSIKNSYSTGAVSGRDDIGGLVGENIGELVDEIFMGLIENSYSTGKVSVNDSIDNSEDMLGDNSVGGLVGNNEGDLEFETVGGKITNSFYDKTKNPDMPDEEISGITGKTTQELSYGKTFKDATWDIVADSTVTQSTPVIKYDEDEAKYYWAIAPLALSYTLSDKSKIYDGENQSLSTLYTDVFGINSSLIGNNYKFQVNGSDVTGYTNAGTYSNIKVVLTGTNDFLTIDSSDKNTDGKYTITPKAITVSADNKSKISGTTDSALTYKIDTVNGLIGSDTLSGLLTRISGEDAGKYIISKGALSNSNYSITFNNGIYTIIAKATPIVPIVPETPVVVEPKPKNKEVEDTITAIVNQTVLKVKMPQVNKPTLEKVAKDDVEISQNTQIGRVDLRDNSLIQIVNGGVNLPIGVEQLFFTANDVKNINNDEN